MTHKRKNASIISSGSNISLSFPKNGRVKEVLVENGQKVYKGQILAKLSAPDSEGAVKPSKRSLETSESTICILEFTI